MKCRRGIALFLISRARKIPLVFDGFAFLHARARERRGRRRRYRTDRGAVKRIPKSRLGSQRPAHLERPDLAPQDAEFEEIAFRSDKKRDPSAINSSVEPVETWGGDMPQELSHVGGEGRHFNRGVSRVLSEIQIPALGRRRYIAGNELGQCSVRNPVLELTVNMPDMEQSKQRCTSGLNRPMRMM
jgi:hypothetical protein